MTIFFVKMLKSSFGCGLTIRPIAQGEAGLRPTTIDRRDYRLPLLVKYYKPKGLDLRSVVSFAGDEFELDLYHPVGQLAADASGLFLWSRSVRISRELQDVRRGVVTVMEVEVWGTVNAPELGEALARGVSLGVTGFEKTYSARLQEAYLVPESPLQELRSRIIVCCVDGRGKIPVMLERCGYQVAAVGGFSLGDMQEGQLQAASPQEEAWACQLAGLPASEYPEGLLPEGTRNQAKKPRKSRRFIVYIVHFNSFSQLLLSSWSVGSQFVDSHFVAMSEGAHKIFVGGLPQDCPQESLSEYFGKFGTITDVVVMTDRDTGRCRGFGFVTFDTADAVEMVMGQHGEHQILGKWVDCKRATREGSKGVPPAKGGGGGGGGGKGGGKYGATLGGFGGSYGKGYGGGGKGGYGGAPAYGGYGGAAYGAAPYGAYGGAYGGYCGYGAAYGGSKGTGKDYGGFGKGAPELCWQSSSGTTGVLDYESLYLGRQADRLSEFPGNFLAHASRHSISMRFATTALSLYILYTSASAHGEVAPLCEFHGSPDAPDVAALLQVGSVKNAENSSFSINVSGSGDGVLDRSAEMLTGISLNEASSPKATHSYGIFHYRVWSHPHWKNKNLPENWRVQNVLNSAKAAQGME
eukprot:symbB.v1.2.002739.t1/scaffold146.1/size298692/20